MRVLILSSTVFVIFCLLGVTAAVSRRTALHHQRDRINEMYEKLATSCPDEDTDRLRITMEKVIYRKLKSKLNKCTRNAIIQPRVVNNISTRTIDEITPSECLTARNLTESWRLDHEGGGTRPGGPYSYYGYACDLHEEATQWFRFTGAAGNRLLNTCPLENSCGTARPYWSNDFMPEKVGVPTNIRVFGSYGGNCKYRVKSVEVMRCSAGNNHDFIYKQSIAYPTYCREGFCGMKVFDNNANGTVPATEESTAPMECRKATNFTGAWRQDTNGSDIQPIPENRQVELHSLLGYACDFNTDSVEWFRFKGSAGNKMLNKQPPNLSCGTNIALWTNGTMPRDVGVPTTVIAYGGFGSHTIQKKVEVMRCSLDTNSDFIYKQLSTHTESCLMAFCGMMERGSERDIEPTSRINKII